MDDEILSHYRDAVANCNRLGARATLGPRGTELRDQIERAFADWPPNSGLTWVQAEMLDNREADEILREGALIESYARWQDVPPELLAAFPSASSFLDDAGFNFYWPALMVWELLYGRTYELGSPADRLEHWPSRLRPLKEQQAEVFSAYMQYIIDRRESHRSFDTPI